MTQIVVDGVLASYEVVNPKGKRVMLVLHGWGHDKSQWVDIANNLDEHFKYILVDLPGFGGTEHLDGVADVPEYGDFVLALMKKLDVKKAWLFGHSFGGQIASYLAVTHSQMIEGLVLVSPAVIRLKSMRDVVKIFIFGRFGLLKKVVPRLWVEEVLKRVTYTDYFESSELQREILKKITRYELIDELDRIKVPVLLVWGELDKAIAYKAKDVLKRIPKSELKVLYGEDHNVHLTNPALLVWEIKAYFRRLNDR